MPRPKRKPRAANEESFGARLRRLRLAKGLTQLQLGQQVGLSDRMVAYYEIQGGEPRPELVTKLSDSLGVSVALLLGHREPLKRELTEAADNARLWRRLKRVQELPPHDRKAVLKMIDAMADAVGRKAS